MAYKNATKNKFKRQGKTEYRLSSHAMSNLVIHLVLVAKYRYALFQGKEEFIKDSLHDIAKEYDLKILEMELGYDEGKDGQTNHIHLLLQIPTTLSISEIVARLKARLSMQLNVQYPEMKTLKAIWKRGFYAETVSPIGGGIDNVRQYIKEQREK
jgi:putative transposase